MAKINTKALVFSLSILGVLGLLGLGIGVPLDAYFKREGTCILELDQVRSFSNHLKS